MSADRPVLSEVEGTYRIAVIPGDGTGPEVVHEGLKALEAAAAATGFRYHTETYDLGGDRYLKTGDILPDSVLEELRGFDAIYLGAVGHPEVTPGILEKGLLLRLRFELDQYINLRRVRTWPLLLVFAMGGLISFRGVFTDLAAQHPRRAARPRSALEQGARNREQGT